MSETRLVYDLSWPTCRDKPVLEGEVAARAAGLLARAAEEHGWYITRMRIEPAGAQIRVEADPQVSPHILARTLKAGSSPVLREEYPDLQRLPSLWTRAYTARTVSPGESEEDQP